LSPDPNLSDVLLFLKCVVSVGAAFQHVSVDVAENCWNFTYMYHLFHSNLAYSQVLRKENIQNKIIAPVW